MTCRLVSFALLLAALLNGLARAEPRTIDYYYIDASEGSSSGGHAAIGFDEEIFHFQYVEPGLIRATRDDFRHFRHLYGFLQNRTMEVSRIEVSEPAFMLFRDAFNRRYLIQNEHFSRLEVMHRDSGLIERLLRSLQSKMQGPSEPSPPLPGLGFFFAATAAAKQKAGAAPSVVSDIPAMPASVPLRGKIEERYGRDYLSLRKQELTEKFRALHFDARDYSSEEVSAERLVPSPYGLSDRYDDLLLGLNAIEILESNLSVIETSLLSYSNQAFVLSPREMEILARFRERLQESLLHLVGSSSRPDWAFAFLVEFARLHAVERSLDLGRLVFLDTRPDGTVGSSETKGDESSINRSFLAGISDEAARHFDKIRVGSLAAGGVLSPSDYSKLEYFANIMAALAQARREDRKVPYLPDGLVPERSAPPRIVPRPGMEGDALSAAAAELDELRQRYEQRLKSLYTYHLIERNCVTEIFRTLEAGLAEQIGNRPVSPSADALPGTLEQIKAQSAATLGGWVDVDRLGFIPFVSSRRVGSSYRIGGHQKLLSYRRQRLANLSREENPLWVWLRESNVLTSSLYRTKGDDSAFLFFTDDLVWPRPLLGAVNSAISLAHTALGMIILPFDGGDILKSGIDGVVASAPEMFFFNIRKGRFLLPPEPFAEPVEAGP